MDYLIFTVRKNEMIEEFKLAMTREFEMTDLGRMSDFLGLEVKQDKAGILL